MTMTWGWQATCEGGQHYVDGFVELQADPLQGRFWCVREYGGGSSMSIPASAARRRIPLPVTMFSSQRRLERSPQRLMQ